MFKLEVVVVVEFITYSVFKLMDTCNSDISSIIEYKNVADIEELVYVSDYDSKHIWCKTCI